MKTNRLALSAMIASACISGSAFGQTSRTAAPRYAPALRVPGWWAQCCSWQRAVVAG